MRNLMAAIWAAFLLAGCANIETPLDDGYQPGDVTRTTYGGVRHGLSLQEQWCEGGDLIAKQVLLMSVRAAVPGYPEDGLCTDLTKVLTDAD